MDAIHWDEIDAEVRPFVRLLNECHGIRTEWSCAGHGDESGYVSFTVDSLETLRGLLLILPKGACRINMAQVGPGFISGSTWRCEADTDAPDDHHLRFAIRWYGHPGHERFALLASFERALGSRKGRAV